MRMKYITLGLPTTAVILAAGVLGVVSGTAAGTAFSLAGAQLFDFETPQEFQKWTVRDLTEFRRTTRWAASGKAAAAITYHKWSAGKEKWPAVIALRGRGALSVTDFSPFDALVFHAFNPQNFPVLIKLHLRDAGQKRFSRSFSLGAKTSETFELRIPVLAHAIDVTHVAELHFFTTQPRRTYTVYVDDVRLTVDAPERARRILYRA